MRYNNTLEFPDWVKNYKDSQNTYPTGYQEIADELIAKGNEMARKWRGIGVKELPYNQAEIDRKLGARYDYYEHYKVFCAHKGSRPSEWDHLYDCEDVYYFSRSGGFVEVNMGEWYLLLGFEHD